MTGLYAESHGIVANVSPMQYPLLISSSQTPKNFWDPDSGLEFHYSNPDITWDPAWWYGEPVIPFAFRAMLYTHLVIDVGDS